MRGMSETAHTGQTWHAGLNRNVVLLALSSLCADVSTEMIHPLLPIFLTTALDAPASAATSSGQSSTRRPAWKSEPPIPGRSTLITRRPSRATRASGTKHAHSTRAPGAPWQRRSGVPSAGPCVA